MKELLHLRDQILNCSSDEEKLNLLTSSPKFPKLDIPSQIVLESLFAIGQGDRIFEGGDMREIDALIRTLLPIEEFYKKLGGIVGYHVKFLELLHQKKKETPTTHYEPPPGVNIAEYTSEVASFVKKGIETLEEIAEIYPIAGAADRLNLKDPKTGESLPAAELQFLGYTLLEGLIRDVIGREYVFFKLTNKQITIPLVLMTSQEKNNRQHILNIIESKKWFNRPKERFFFIEQPLVPVIDSKGDWVLKAPLVPSLKPGGHGALWRLLFEQNALDWLKTLKTTKALIRQINNPIAGIDYGLLAFTGIGCSENKKFGFCSCERFVGSEEGMIVLAEQEGHTYSITNVEYTEFEKQGIQDCSENSSSPYSCFPANSNILFADLEAIEKMISENPYPGLTINLKQKNGSALAGRLESTMQNIADNITFSSKKSDSPTFVTYNLRRKTLAATKKTYVEGGPLQDTPEGVLLEILKNNKELLERCGFQVPDHFLFTYHPALGPLYAIIVQKIRKGILHDQAELKLDIAEIFIENLDLDGSLLVFADQPTGHLNQYSDQTGKCILKNVIVKGNVHIKIEGNGEFVAENIIFQKNYNIAVPSGHRMVAVQNNSVEFVLEPINQPTWKWNYRFNEEGELVLTFIELSSRLSP